MRVNVLSYEPAGGWILYDYAVRLAAALQPHVEHASVNHAQLAGCDVTFHVNYWGLRNLQAPGLHATMVTHIDTVEKFNLVRSQAAAGVWGYCMSEETARRLNTLSGMSLFKNFAPPAMMAAEHRQLSLLIAGRLYEDGRKNDGWAIDFIKTFRPADLLLRVMGAGWESQLDALRAQGYTVAHSAAFERGLYTQWLRASDHLLVTGNDEGALSTLDAILHGVVPIVTAQGYHLEQEGELITFATHAQLMAVARRLQAQLDETNAMRARMTDWDAFARKHVAHWRAALAQRTATSANEAQAAA
jgi:hypothetical protein